MEVSVAERIPAEIVSHILSYLAVSDRKDCSLVCKRWYEASLHPTLGNDLVVILNTTDAGPALKQSLRTLQNRTGIRLSLSDVCDQADVDTIIRSFPSSLCTKLSSLDVAGSNLSETAFVAVIENCKNLQRLDISNCNSLLMSGKHLIDNLSRVSLPKLTSLSLSSLHHLSDATLAAILRVAPKLETLNMASVPMMFSSLSFASGRPNSATVTFTRFLAEIKQISTTLKSLNLSGTTITDGCLLALFQTEGLRLSTLQLNSCKEITNSGITAAVKLMSCMESLDLAYNTQLGDVTLKEVAQNLIDLKQLNMNKVPLGSGAVKYLRLLTVESLELNGCLKADLSPSVMEDTCKIWGRNLRCIDLSGSVALSREALTSICTLLVNLKQLNLSSCFNVDDGVLRELSKNLTGLTHLSLGWCSKLTDFGLLGLVDKEFSVDHSADAMCRCHRADISSRSDVPQFFYDSPARHIIPDSIPTQEEIDRSLSRLVHDQPYPLCRLSKLVQLDLSGCRKLTDKSISVIIRFPAIVELNLSLCSRLTDVSLTSIAQHNPLLEMLSLGSCREITDNGISQIFKFCRRLSHLSLPNCQLLSDATVGNILAYELNIKYIDISYSNISTDAISRLEQKLRYLRTVHKRYTTTTNNTNTNWD